MRSVQNIANMTTDFDMEFIKSYECEGCGNEVTVSKILMPFGPKKGEWVESEHGCDCELYEIIKQNQEAANRERLKRIFEENSLINPSLREATFENFDRTNFQNAYKQAKRFADEFDLKQPRNLFFQGSFGTGKSHLSVSIAKALTEKGFKTIFISTPKLLTKIRNTYNKNSELGEEKIIETISAADLVVFDDIGAEGDISGWAMQKLFEVIDQRAGKHNIYTTNLSSAELESSKDLQRIFSRMMMDAEPIIMNGTDYRRRNFKVREGAV